MRFDFDVGVIAEERFGGYYEVFCNRCESSIGVMGFSTVRQAVFNTLARGGVLCPPCRAVTCDSCGNETKEAQMVETYRGRLRLCSCCSMVWEDLRGRVIRAIVDDEPPTNDWGEELCF